MVVTITFRDEHIDWLIEYLKQEAEAYPHKREFINEILEKSIRQGIYRTK